MGILMADGSYIGLGRRGLNFRGQANSVETTPDNRTLAPTGWVSSRKKHLMGIRAASSMYGDNLSEEEKFLHNEYAKQYD